MASSDPKVDLIATVPLFKGLGRKELEAVAQLVEEVDVPAGQVLMRQGDIGHEMVVVVTGRFGIERDGTFLRELGPGFAIGEMALLAEGARNATVTALEPSRVLLVAHREFHSLMDTHPTIRLGVLEGLAAKVRWLDEAGIH